MFFPAQSFAADSLLKNMKFGGQIDVQGISADNVADFTTNAPDATTGNANDHIGDVQTRVMIHADWDVLDDVHAKVSLTKNDRNWGDAGGNPQVNGNSQSVDAAGVLGNTFVDQAYIKIDKVGGALDTTLGRQFYGTSGDMIVYYGPSDKMIYGLGTNAIDAARVDWAGSWGGLTLLGGKVFGAPIGTVDNADINLFGVNAAIKGTDMVSGAAYAYDQITRGTGALGNPPGNGAGPANISGVNDNLWVVGLKAKANMGMAWLAGEVAKNFGSNRISNATAGTAASRSYIGWAAKVDAGAKVETPIGGVSPWANVGLGSGDSDNSSSSNNGFTAISGDYRPGTIYGTFTTGSAGALGGLSGAAVGANAVAGNGTLTNRFIWGVGVKTTPTAMNKLTVGASFWDFHTQTSALPATAGSPRPFVGNKHIGSEGDIDLGWQHSENVTLGAGVAEFWPGGLISEANQSTDVTAASANSGVGTSPVRMAYFDVRVKF